MQRAKAELRCLLQCVVLREVSQRGGQWHRWGFHVQTHLQALSRLRQKCHDSPEYRPGRGWQRDLRDKSREKAATKGIHEERPAVRWALNKQKERWLIARHASTKGNYAHTYGNRTIIKIAQPYLHNLNMFRFSTDNFKICARSSELYINYLTIYTQ